MLQKPALSMLDKNLPTATRSIQPQAESCWQTLPQCPMWWN